MMNSMLKTTNNDNHSYNQPLQYEFLQQSFVVFTCTQKQILKYDTVPNTNCMSSPSANRIMDAFWLCYHIKLPDSKLPSKALAYFNITNVSMVKDKI